MQVAPQQTQPPLGPASYAVDSSSTSRRQYQQQSPQGGEQSRSSSNPRSSPHSSRRPSRRPSANTTSETPQQGAYHSAAGSHPSISNTPRGQDLLSATHPSPVDPATTSSPPYQQQSRREQRAQQGQHGGPPILPPPRTSSNQKGQNFPLPSGEPLVDRSVTDRDESQGFDDQASRSRNIEVGFVGAPLMGGEREPASDATTAAASAARSRRRGPASPEGPQRATTTREAGTQQSPAAVQSRSASHVISPAPPATSTRDAGQVINRVIVDDPAIDLQREEERQLESVPGLGIAGSTAVNDVARVTPRTRQDHAAGATSSGRRRDAKFGEYMLGQTLGEGEFGKVKLGWKKDGSVQVAIKLIRRESLGTNPSRLPKIYREIKILETLHHPNIVKLHEMVETREFIGIILEYASGGELFDYILTHRYLKDNTARKLFAQLVSGVGYLHKKGIVHRDLKLENLLLDRNRNIIITDFGFANTFDPRDELEADIEYNLTNRDYVKRMDLERVTNGTRRGDLMATSCGSPCYAAPELVVTDSLYTGRKVDVWSCGVILYAMLAGYLPFDDDPANPEGDNINLLYKYITTTPLTFPEYVTPHARDLLRRILVADPRKRADLFEVARHSWLSDFSHVVAQVTSSTTTVGEIANATVTADQQDAPPLARSASVREPTKTMPSTISPVGGLSHQGKIDPAQSSDKTKAPRDPKRRTVQVEYVAPQSQTTRGEALPPINSSGTDGSSPAISTGPSKTRVRAGTEGPESVPRQYNTGTVTAKSPTQESSLPQSRSAQLYQGSTSANRTQQRPSSSKRDMAPPARPPKDLPRSVSDSTSAFGQVPSSASNRPTTGGSMASAGHGRLPSRGNSYSQPLAPTVAATNAQGRVTQPKTAKQYNISAPIPQSDPYSQAESIGRPSTQQHVVTPPTLGPQRDTARGHKRSNTLGNFFRTGSISGPRSQTQSPGEPQREKRYPPTSMKAPITSGSPRQSTDSRRPSLGFGRKSSDLRKNSDLSKQEKPRRFSLLPASFSFKSFTSANSGRDQSSEFRPASERGQGSKVPQPPPSRGQSRPQTMAYGRGQSGTNTYQVNQEDPAGLDGSRDRLRDDRARQTRRNDALSLAPPQAQQTQYGSPPNQDQQDLFPPRFQQPGQSYLGTPTESEVSLQPRPAYRPVYPPGFGNESYEEESRPSMQQARPARGPNVLQKNNRKFTDAYERDQEPGTGGGGNHAGTSGAAKRVMDFFRRRGKARGMDDRV